MKAFTLSLGEDAPRRGEPLAERLDRAEYAGRRLASGVRDNDRRSNLERFRQAELIPELPTEAETLSDQRRRG